MTPIFHSLARFTLAIVFIGSTASSAKAQVAPAPAATAAPATPTFKAGWIAQVVSYKGMVMGEVPLASFVLGAAQDDAFAQLGRLGVPGSEAGLVIRGLINAPEAGRYGFHLSLVSTVPSSTCAYTFSVDGAKQITGRGPLSQNPGGDKAIELPAGRHPAELRVGCSNGLPKIRVSLMAKLPSADEVAPLGTDFIIHATRAIGD